MKLSEDYLRLLCRATGLRRDQLPEDPTDRLAAVNAAQLLDQGAQRNPRGREPATYLQAAELERLEEIIPVAWARFGGSSWQVAMLMEGAAADSTATRARIGRILGRAVTVGHVTDGYCVECAGTSHGTKVWRLRAVG